MVSRVAVTMGAPANVSAFAPTMPTHQAGDRIVIMVAGKETAATNPTLTAGWNLWGTSTGGTGTAGADAGPMRWGIWYKDVTSSSEPAPTVTPGSTPYTSWVWIAASYRPGAGKVWRDFTLANTWVKSASDTTTASPLTGAASTWAAGNFPTAGDALLCFGVVPTDLGTALGATTITSPGLSGGTVTAATTQYVETALGNDMAAVWASHEGFTGTATGGVTMSFTITGATNQSGPLIAVALREADAAVAATFAGWGLVPI